MLEQYGLKVVVKQKATDAHVFRVCMQWQAASACDSDARGRPSATAWDEVKDATKPEDASHESYSASTWRQRTRPPREIGLAARASKRVNNKGARYLVPCLSRAFTHTGLPQVRLR